MKHCTKTIVYYLNLLVVEIYMCEVKGESDAVIKRMNSKVFKRLINGGNLMKKLIIFLLAIVMSMTIPIQVLAYDEVLHEFPVLTLNSVYEIQKCVQIQKTGLSEIKSIDKRTMMKINGINADEKEKAMAIFDSLGIVFVNDSAQQKSIANNIENIQHIETSTVYSKVDANGQQIYISEEECMEKIKEYNSNTITNAKTKSKPSDYIEDDEGYVRKTIAYFYLGGNGKFSLLGQWEWLTTPICRFKDAFSLYTTDLRWENKNKGAYEKIVSYKTSLYQSNGEQIVNIEAESTQEDPTISEDGVFYEWDLPNDSSGINSSLTHSDFICQIWGTAYVQDYDDYTQELCVYTRYVHKKLSIASSYSISPDKKGVKLNSLLSISTTQTAYAFHFTWDYASVL